MLPDSFTGSIVPSIYKTSTPTEAELTKLLENIQRDMNIALINEFAKICDVLPRRHTGCHKGSIHQMELL